MKTADAARLGHRKNTSLKLFLDGFRNEAALGINWILVGPSHQDARPHEGVLRSYTECVKTPHPLVKSIANTYFLANIADQPHTFEYRCERLAAVMIASVGTSITAARTLVPSMLLVSALDAYAMPARGQAAEPWL